MRMLLVCVTVLVGAGALRVEAQTPSSLDDGADGTLIAPPVKKAAAEKKPEVKPAEASPAATKAPAPARAESAAPEPESFSGPALDALWARWQQANASRDAELERTARAALVSAHAVMGSPSFDVWAVGLMRGAAAWESAGDSGAAIEIGSTALVLAPALPQVWFSWARLSFSADPTELGRWLGALRKGVVLTFSDARFARPLKAEGAWVFFLAWLVTTVLVSLVFALRQGRYLLHDVHLFFGSGVAWWKTTVLAATLLLALALFGVAVLWVLVAVFAALALYLKTPERTVLALLLAGLAGAPAAAEWVVAQTAFAQTPAELLYRIEHQDPEVDRLVAELESRVTAGQGHFAERFVLGRFYLQRGQLKQAVSQLKEALALAPESAEARVALARCLFLQGDLENSRTLLEAAKVTSTNATVLVALSRVYQRRVEVYGSANAGEIDKAEVNWLDARKLDPTLPPHWEEAPSSTAHRAWATLPLPQSSLLALAQSQDMGARVRGQFAAMLLGDRPEAQALWAMLLAVASLWAFGFASSRLGAATPCHRCGLPVSRRSAPELPVGGTLCTQCINVFVRKDLVSAAERSNKQLAVARYEGRLSRTKAMLGLIWAGLGHLFSGRPVRGALLSLVFSAALVRLLLWAGLFRVPFEALPAGLKALPVALVLLCVYPWSQFSLRREE